jgi:hypothetical protein
MKYQLSQISFQPAIKLLTYSYAIAGFMFTPLGFIILVTSRGDTGRTILGIIYLFGPILYGIIGLFSATISIWIYNKLANKIGGIEFTLTQISNDKINNQSVEKENKSKKIISIENETITVKTRIITCPNCNSTVLPNLDGTCPSCAMKIVKPKITQHALAADGSTGGKKLHRQSRSPRKPALR